MMDSPSLLPAILDALDEYPLSLEEIPHLRLHDMVERVCRKAIPASSGTAPDELRSVLGQLIRARCLSLLAEGGEWNAYPAGSDSAISFHVLGRTFFGHAAIGPKSVRVDLRNGTGVRSRVSVLHDWTPSIYTEEPWVGSQASPDGTDCAARLFLGLCLEEISPTGSAPDG